MESDNASAMTLTYHDNINQACTAMYKVAVQKSSDWSKSWQAKRAT